MTVKISTDEFDRDKRISALERQVLVLSGQVAARDAAFGQILREMSATQHDAASTFVAQYPQMIAEIDAKVLSAITEADHEEHSRT